MVKYVTDDGFNHHCARNSKVFKGAAKNIYTLSWKSDCTGFGDKFATQLNCHRKQKSLSFNYLNTFFSKDKDVHIILPVHILYSNGVYRLNKAE